jgi:hypothetical protein
MRKIAIIQFRDVDIMYDDYHDVTKLIASKITDWVEVDEETFRALLTYQGQGKYRVVEFIPNQLEFIKNTVDDYKRYVAIQQEKERKYREEKEKKRQEKQIAKQAKTLEEKKNLLKKLKEELGE